MAYPRKAEPQLVVRELTLRAPGGRMLFERLQLKLGRERVAVIGRNGVGKSSLLEALAGASRAPKDMIWATSAPFYVAQDLAERSKGLCVEDLRVQHGLEDHAFQREYAQAGFPAVAPGTRLETLSGGELKKLWLVAAKLSRAQFLLLDEPTQDLDDMGRRWLKSWQSSSRIEGLVVATHDQALLSTFSSFFVIAESGGWQFQGAWSELQAQLEAQERAKEEQYVRNLNQLVHRERHNMTVCRRRARKKNLGRLHELARAPSMAQLKGKKSYAQTTQGRSAKIRAARISGVRDWALATRRAMSVSLPLSVVLPKLAQDDGLALVELSGVSAVARGRVLFEDLDLYVERRHRVGVMGPNGAGKTTLLRLLVGLRKPESGIVRAQNHRIGVIEQSGANWKLDAGVLEVLRETAGTDDPTALAEILVAHKFPLMLAERPMHSLSPGERVRGAMICLMQRQQTPQALVLDEPTYGLDFVGVAALEATLRAYRGALVVASHDRRFLTAIGVNTRVELGDAA